MTSNAKTPTTSKGEPCAFDENEPCLQCPVVRKDHEALTDHDDEPRFAFVCVGCPDDLVWDSDNVSEHPSYDHDFDPIPWEQKP